MAPIEAAVGIGDAVGIAIAAAAIVPGLAGRIIRMSMGITTVPISIGDHGAEATEATVAEVRVSGDAVAVVVVGGKA